VSFQSVPQLDAGSVIPDLIRDRHDVQKLNPTLNCYTVWQAGIQLKVAWIPACAGMTN
jgi:hypothetical protein